MAFLLTNMSPVGFAIIFGNENTSSWKEYWWFILETHPSIDRGEVTKITDQDKGSRPPSRRYLDWLATSSVPSTDGRTSFYSVAVWVEKCHTLHFGCTTSRVSAGQLRVGRGNTTDTSQRCSPRTFNI